jgi:universal stress protein A
VALNLATQFNSTLTLIHSVNLDYYVASDEYARYDFPQLLQQTEKVAQQRLQKIVQHLRHDGFDVNGTVTIGHAGQHICDSAEKAKVGLIVTSTHGRTGFKHVLIGSTAEYMVRHAECPVLVVPSHDRPIIKPKGVKS